MHQNESCWKCILKNERIFFLNFLKWILNIYYIHLTFPFFIHPSSVSNLGQANIQSRQPITLGTWHEIRAVRNNINGALYIDDDINPVIGESPGTSIGLSTSASTYIGGIPTAVSIPTRAIITGGKKWSSTRFHFWPTFMFINNKKPNSTIFFYILTLFLHFSQNQLVTYFYNYNIVKGILITCTISCCNNIPILSTTNLCQLCETVYQHM